MTQCGQRTYTRNGDESSKKISFHPYPEGVKKHAIKLRGPRNAGRNISCSAKVRGGEVRKEASRRESLREKKWAERETN